MSKAETIRELEAKKLKLRMKQIDLVSNCADRNDKRIRKQEDKMLKEIAEIQEQIKKLKSKTK